MTATVTMLTIKVELGSVTAMGTFQGKLVGSTYISDAETVDTLHRQIRSSIIRNKRATQMLDLNPKKTLKQNKLKNGSKVQIIFEDEDPNNDSYNDADGYDGNGIMVDLPTLG